MEINAKWILRNHRYIISRQRFLESFIFIGESTLTTESDIVDTITYMNRMAQNSNSNIAFGSEASYSAINLQRICTEKINNYEESIAKWVLELKNLKRLQRIYDASVCSLTKEEQAFVKLHFDEGMSLASLADIPLCEGAYPKSHSSLKRMLKAIERKVEYVTSLDN